MTILNNKELKKYLGNTLLMMGEKGYRITINLIVGVLIARYLGPELLGKLSYAHSLVGIFSILAILGLDSILVREFSSGRNNTNELLGTAIVLKLLGSFLMLSALVLLLPFTNSDSEESLLVLFIALGYFFQSTTVIEFYYRAKGESRHIVVAQIIQVTISAALKLYLIYINAPLLWFAAATIVESIILAALFLLFYFIENTDTRKWRFKVDTCIYLLSKSWTLILTGFTISIYMKIDQIMIKEMLGPTEVGIYSVVVRMTEALYFVPIVLSSALLPWLCRTKNTCNIKHHYSFLFSLSLWQALTIVITLFCFSKSIVITVFGIEYIAAASILEIYAWVFIVISFSVTKGEIMIVENIHHLKLFYSFFGAILNIILNYFWIQKYGIIGAAVSTLVAQITSAIALPLLHSVDRKIVIVGLKSISPIPMLTALLSR